ncbi:peptidase inhibitor family I36 protein [Streptomyces roseoverticillatus]|uniref:peptidase inhibitor family I36 protein n=1 Tax=Streptomyces roseoverticillatus TaxID=66429 RepID=UPI001F3C0F1B|nr:peptidase inhibitor family I36 protein [Streptomyces roseoverticillatus]MCF3106109.1 peptidase inhibitor family I36 protein [Streptomyces roseoverticillatus]
MKPATRKSVRSVIAAAVVGASVLLPAAAAQSRSRQEIPICPQVIGLCTWTEPDAEGATRMFQRPTPKLNPLVRSAKNQSGQTWCLYPRPSYGGQPFVLRSGSYTPGLGLAARSARPC